MDYESLWKEFDESDYAGTFSAWLVDKLVDLEARVTVIEERARRRQEGVPREQYEIMQRMEERAREETYRLREQLMRERQANAAPPAIGQPRPVPTVDPNPWRDGGTADPNTTFDPNRWTDNTGGTYPNPLRGSDAVRVARELEELRERIREQQGLTQDSDRGEP